MACKCVHVGLGICIHYINDVQFSWAGLYICKLNLFSTLSVHAQRGLQYLVCVSACLSFYVFATTFSATTLLVRMC